MNLIFSCQHSTLSRLMICGAVSLSDYNLIIRLMIIQFFHNVHFKRYLKQVFCGNKIKEKQKKINEKKERKEQKRKGKTKGNETILKRKIPKKQQKYWYNKI